MPLFSAPQQTRPARAGRAARAWGWMVAAAWCLSAPHVWAAPKQPGRPRLLVSPLQGRGVSPSTADVLTQMVVAEIRLRNTHVVISAQDVSSVLSVEQQRQLLDCDGTGCASDLAGALDVDELVTGSVTLVGRMFVLSLNRVRMRDAVTLAAVTAQQTGDSEAVLLPLVPGLVRAAMTGEMGQRPAPPLPSPSPRADVTPPPAAPPPAASPPAAQPPAAPPARPPAAKGPRRQTAPADSGRKRLLARLNDDAAEETPPRSRRPAPREREPATDDDDPGALAPARRPVGRVVLGAGVVSGVGGALMGLVTAVSLASLLGIFVLAPLAGAAGAGLGRPLGVTYVVAQVLVFPSAVLVFLALPPTLLLLVVGAVLAR